MKFAYGVIVNMAESVKTSVDRFDQADGNLNKRLAILELNHAIDRLHLYADELRVIEATISDEQGEAVVLQE